MPGEHPGPPGNRHPQGADPNRVPAGAPKDTQDQGCPGKRGEVPGLHPREQPGGRGIRGKIEKLEHEISELDSILTDSELYTNDPDKFDASMKRYSKAKQELETAETRWIELEEMRLKAEG